MRRRLEAILRGGFVGGCVRREELDVIHQTSPYFPMPSSEGVELGPGGKLKFNGCNDM